jgi:glyoxylase-like metal-dependent hydrolase (beta-lactamase superfamily II)
MTDQISKERGEKRAEFLFSGDSVFAFGSFAFRCFYPGEGHTPDNLVVWFAKARVLYGGCLVKSTEAESLGNLADANPKAWPKSLEKVLNEFPDLRFVVPGHQSWANSGSIKHTLRLLKDFQK